MQNEREKKKSPMNIKEKYRQFRQWQKNPLDFKMSSTHYHCQNCGHDFEGNFCPCCGQAGKLGAVTWNSIRQGVMEVWGVGSRSMPYTLLQLLFRPGYMISEYINGHRQVSFPPVKMLVIVAALIYIFDTTCNLNIFGAPSENTLFKESDNAMLYNLERWMGSHYDWSSLLFFMLMLIPTHIVFRFSPRNARHTLPQGFFIQTFNSTLYLMLMLLCGLVLSVFGLKTDTAVGIEFAIIVFIVLLVVYKQLFGYSLLSTAWRILLLLFYFAFELPILGGLIYTFSTPSDASISKAEGAAMFVLGIVFFLLTTDCYKCIFYDRPVKTLWAKIREGFILVFLLVSIQFAVLALTGSFKMQTRTNLLIAVTIFSLLLIVLLILTGALIKKIFIQIKQSITYKKLNQTNIQEDV